MIFFNEFNELFIKPVHFFAGALTKFSLDFAKTCKPVQYPHIFFLPELEYIKAISVSDLEYIIGLIISKYSSMMPHPLLSITVVHTKDAPSIT